MKRSSVKYANQFICFTQAGPAIFKEPYIPAARHIEGIVGNKGWPGYLDTGFNRPISISLPIKLSLVGAMEIRIRAVGPSGNPVSCCIIHSHVYPVQDIGLIMCWMGRDCKLYLISGKPGPVNIRSRIREE